MNSLQVSRSLRALGLALTLGVFTLAAQPQLTVTRPTGFGNSSRLSDLPDTPAPPFRDHPPLPLPARGHGPNTPQTDPAVQGAVGPLVAANNGVSFDGIGANGSAPPDTNIAVGPNHIVEVVNSRYQVFNKAGSSILGPSSLGSLWSALGGSCASANAGDPVVQYDRLADRWLITQLGALSSPYSECIAVSKTGDPTGAYSLYSYNYASSLNDYPKVGVWPTASNGAYTFTYNLFANGQTFTGAQLCAYDRTAMIAGNASAASVCYTIAGDGGYLPVDLDGATPPVNGTPAYFLTFETTTSLRVYKLAPNFATPASSTLTQMADIGVASFVQACDSCVPQPGTSEKLDTLSDRPMYRLAYRAYSDHASMVLNHSVTAGSSVGVRWYELRSSLSPASSFSLFQQGTYAPDATYRWMGSAAMDSAGNLAIGYSASSASINPGLRYTGRNATDALGTLQSEFSIQAGTGSQSTNLSRWGDYAALRIDPSDDCTFWFSSEYEKTTGTFNWSTRVGSFKFTNCGTAPAPDFSLSASPSSVTLVQGASGPSTINVTAINGYSGSVSLTVSGCPSGATCTLNPTSVTPGISSTLSIVTGTALAGTYPLTVQGTDGTLTHTTNVSLTIQAAPVKDFSLSASPSTITLVQGASGPSTINVTAINGYSGSVGLTVLSGCPSGATCSLNPTSVTPGSPSTLTINTGTAAAGTYTLTVKGADGTLTHTTTVSLTIQASTPDFSLSVNPTSLTVNKPSGGSVTVTVTRLAGNPSVALSVTGLPSGATASFRPATVSAPGTSVLTIDTKGNTPRGTSTLTISGSANGVAHTIPLTLIVQ